MVLTTLGIPTQDFRDWREEDDADSPLIKALRALLLAIGVKDGVNVATVSLLIEFRPIELTLAS